MSASDNVLDLGIAGGDRLQKIAVIVPCYIYLSSWAYANHLEIINNFPETIEIEVIVGVYTPHAMRMAVKNLLDPKRHSQDWERIVVIEADMILPKNGLLKHAFHTDDIVGSVYVQHAPPFHINAQWRAGDGSRRWGHPTPESWRPMLEHEALYKCDVVGLGFTSIARKVIDEWPDDVLMFWNDFSPIDKGDPTTLGEISHDVWFCTHARDLGFNVYIDTSIRCAQRTEGEVTLANYMRWHADAFKPKPSKLLVPRGPGSEVGARRG
jgi:hypothetical protein